MKRLFLTADITGSPGMKDVIILANWKMYKSLQESQSFIEDLIKTFGKTKNLSIVILAPFPYIGYLALQCRGTCIKIGAQNMFHKEWGHYTGEVSAPILAGVGCTHVMLGHSIRRELFGENDETVNRKMLLAVRHGIVPVVMIGETIEEKKSGMIGSILERQVRTCLKGVSKSSGCMICYEPRWAIGTGETPTPAEIESAHLYIKQLVTRYYGREVTHRVPVIYAGSCQTQNVSSIYLKRGVDGVGFGACSLDYGRFESVIRSAIGVKMRKQD